MKKFVFIVLLVVIIVFGYFFVQKNNKDIPSDFNEKLSYAHKDILMFNYEHANKLYKAAVKQSDKKEVLEEYLAFLVQQEKLGDSYKVAKKVLSVNPNHFLANLVNTAYYVKKNNLTQAINELKGPAGNSSSFNNAIFAILSTINYYIEKQDKQFNIISEQIKGQLPDFYYNQLIQYELMGKNYKSAQDTARTTLAKYPSVDNIILYSKLLYKDNKSEGIKLFKDYLDDNFLTDKMVANYLEDNNGINNVTVSKVFSDALYRFSKYSSSKQRISYIEPDNMLIIHVALMLNKNNDLARIQAASYYTKVGDYNIALENFSKLDKNSFYYRLVYPDMVKIFNSLGRTEDSIKILNTVKNYDTTNPQPLLELGHIYHKKHNYSEAIKYYTAALDTSNNYNFELGKWLAYYFRGISYNTSNNWTLAEKDLLEAMRINNQDPLLLNYLGYSWLDKDYNIDQAYTLIKSALEKDPNNPNILDSYAWALFKKNDYNGALKVALVAQKSLPYDPSVINHLGDIYYKLGNKSAAKVYWASVLNMNPDDAIKENVTNKVKNKLPAYLTKTTFAEAESSNKISLNK